MNTGVWGDSCTLMLLALIFFHLGCREEWVWHLRVVSANLGAEELEEEVLGATVEDGNSDCPRLWSQTVLSLRPGSALSDQVTLGELLHLSVASVFSSAK